MKILHCPTAICGNPLGLSKGQNELGHDSHTLAFTGGNFSHPVEATIWKKNDSLPLKEWKRWQAIFSVPKQYDVIHYNSGRSLAPKKIRGKMTPLKNIAKSVYNVFYGTPFMGVDVLMAKRKGIVTAVTYQGSDARQGDYCRAHYPIHFCHEDTTVYDSEHDRMNREMISFFDKNVDLIYAVNPDLLNVLPERAKFVPYSSVDPREWTARPIGPTDTKPLHIVHAPSNRKIKGSHHVLAAFAKLEEEGIPFRYTLVENMPYAEAKKAYESADVLIDQLLAGYYGALAVEFMAMAKPVICYMRESDLVHMPDGMVRDMPIINASPESLYDVLKDVIQKDRKELHNIGLAGRSYVETWHDPVKIAAQTLADYEDAKNKKHRTR